ncbi:hypothetical protein ACQY0O_003742 [Thecaphora frezii]
MASSFSTNSFPAKSLPGDARDWSHASPAATQSYRHPSLVGAPPRAPLDNGRLGTADSAASQATLQQQQQQQLRRPRLPSHAYSYGEGVRDSVSSPPAPSNSVSPLQSSSALRSPPTQGRPRLPINATSPGPVSPPQLRPAPLQSNVYGLTPDLRRPAPPALGATSSGKSKSRPMPHEQKANFSVELFAPQFDQRGYPVLSGRAASVKGILRMPATTGCDVLMKISAYTTAGAPAAVWDGIALAPFDLGDERKVFEIRDRLVANYDLARPKETYAPRNEVALEPPMLSKEDLVLPIPFDVKLPLGKSTRVVDGELQTVAVSLPPSFEISSKLAAQERREMRMLSKGKTRTLAAKELMEKGFEKVYRIGCYYQITWTLLRDGVPVPKASKGQKEPAAAEGDILTVPFIFLGEPTSMPPYPPTIPSSLSPRIFTHPGTELGDQWDVHRSTARWGGSLLKTLRRSVDIELHIPAPSVVQAPSHLPMLLILRPQDPTLLSNIRSGPFSESNTAPGSPETGLREDPIEVLAKTNGGFPRSNGDGDSIRTTRSIMSRFIRPSISLARIPGSGASTAGSSIFSGRRPNTAPSTGSSDTAASDSMTNRTYNPNGAIPDLTNLVCVSLIQTTYSSTEGVNETPENRRKIISVADLEEVDVQALLLSSLPFSDEHGSGRSAEELTAIHEASASAKAAGVRVLVGSLSVNQNTPPSFRCQGLEVKYAIKVDLLPVSRVGSDGVEKAFRNLGIRSGRSRGLSEGHSTTASIHTQTQFTQLSNGSSPPTTPPSANGTTRPFGASSPGNERASSDRTGYPGIGGEGVGSSPQMLGLAYSTDGPAVVQGDINEPQEVLTPNADLVSRFPGGPLQPRAVKSYPHNISSGASSVSGSSRAGWTEGSFAQSSSFVSEWGKDRKTVSKLHKSVGELWIDVRMVRAHVF